MKLTSNRRQFINTLGLGFVATQLFLLYGSANTVKTAFSGESPEFWVNPAFAEHKKFALEESAFRFP